MTCCLHVFCVISLILFNILSISQKKNFVYLMFNDTSLEAIGKNLPVFQVKIDILVKSQNFKFWTQDIVV